MKPTFQEMCAVLAAKNCYESGQSVAQIAASAKKSHAVVRRWLKEAGVVQRHEHATESKVDGEAAPRG